MTQNTPGLPDDAGIVRSLSRSLDRLLELADQFDRGHEATGLVNRVTGHLGCGLADLSPVGESFPPWEHINLHRGIVAYLAAHTPEAAWFGISGAHRGGDDLISLLTEAERHGHYRLGAVDFVTVATGPDSTTEVVNLGLVATHAPDGAPAIVALSGPEQHHGPMGGEARLDVLATDRASATAIRQEIEHLMRVHDAYRGHVLRFGHGEHRGNGWTWPSRFPCPTRQAASGCWRCMPGHSACPRTFPG